VVHHPVSNLRLASGVAHIQHMLASGTTVALGADGAVSNDNQNMWEVVKLATILHRVYGDETARPPLAAYHRRRPRAPRAGVGAPSRNVPDVEAADRHRPR
jgi:cytosine/adenosine deaminase-related metal-dependent hydrolase